MVDDQTQQDLGLDYLETIEKINKDKTVPKEIKVFFEKFYDSQVNILLSLQQIFKDQKALKAEILIETGREDGYLFGMEIGWKVSNFIKDYENFYRNSRIEVKNFMNLLRDVDDLINSLYEKIDDKAKRVVVLEFKTEELERQKKKLESESNKEEKEPEEEKGTSIERVQKYLEKKDEATTEEMAKSLGVTFKTINNQINRLLEKGIIKETGKIQTGSRPKKKFALVNKTTK